MLTADRRLGNYQSSGVAPIDYGTEELHNYQIADDVGGLGYAPSTMPEGRVKPQHATPIRSLANRALLRHGIDKAGHVHQPAQPLRRTCKDTLGTPPLHTALGACGPLTTLQRS
jgi:hypothetical protein